MHYFAYALGQTVDMLWIIYTKCTQKTVMTHKAKRGNKNVNNVLVISENKT